MSERRFLQPAENMALTVALAQVERETPDIPPADTGGAGEGERRMTCTGIAAAWCPIHGDCTCPDRVDWGELWFDECPLHGSGSLHADVYQACPLYEAKGACFCSTGLPGDCWATGAAQTKAVFSVGPREMFHA